jgi:transposase, IS30 family
MKYHQLTSGERYSLSALRAQGLNQSQIAKQLGRHRSTICRELKRNSARFDGHYRPSKAIERTSGRRSRSRRNLRFTLEDLHQVNALLRKQWSPQQVSGHLRNKCLLRISHETIYRHIWDDKACGGNLYLHLRGARKNCRKRYGRNDSRGKLAGKRHISERPASVQGRRRIGHWEIDTVVGKGSQHCIVTLVERKTGYVLIGKLKARTVQQLNLGTLRIATPHADQFATITADNGSEFHGYTLIEQALGLKFFFATPHHSWERGTNENTNGLIRQYIPKGIDMVTLTQHDCNVIATKLNTRPRKRLDYETPHECFYAH